MIRVAITGPESTGKSSLAKVLAEHYNTLWVPEYSREYIDNLDRDYTYEDVEKIAVSQIQKEKELLPSAKTILFADTELLVIKIWLEHKFNKTPYWLDYEIDRQKYDLYLLCDIDIPWEYDPQREHPELRQYFFDLYQQKLKNRGFKYIIVSNINK